MEALYRVLAAIGYTHPLHPPATHVVVGSAIAAFVFALMARFTGKTAYETSARHCAGLAAVAVLPTILLGILDWQHRFGGAWLTPIRVKIVLASVLVVLLAAATLAGRRVAFAVRFVLYTCMFVLVVGLGYFGGELVYGGKVSVSSGSAPVVRTAQVKAGEAIFNNDCASCHFADSTQAKFGPGLKDLMKRPTLPATGRPATDENVRHQLTAPVGNMPAFPQLTESDTATLLAYLHTL